MNTTKEGIEVKPGQKWQDQDKRMGGRIVEVIQLGTGTFEGKARVMNSARQERWLSISRMHKHSTGFVLLANDKDMARRALDSE